MSGPPPPPYQQEDPGPPPTYEAPTETYGQQETYEQPQQTYEQQPPQDDYGNQEQTNMYPDVNQQQQQQQQTYDQTAPEEPEDVVSKPTSDGGESASSKWKLGSYEDGDGYFGPRMRRLLTHGVLLTFFALLAFDLWFDTKDSPLGDLKKVDKANKDTSFEDGWGLHAGGLFFLFLGFVGVLVAQILNWRDIFNENKIVNLIIAAVIWLGAFLYWVGGAVVAGSFNELKGKNTEAAAGVYFGEATFVGLLGVSLGLDLLLNLHSKSKRVRIFLIHGTILVLGSLILFFSYATVEKTKGTNSADYSAIQTTAAGWFFVLVGIVLLFVLEFLLHSHSLMDLHGPLIWLGTIGFFLFGAFLTAIGYWALCDGKNVPKKAKSAQNSYYVAYSFLVLVYCLILAIDIKLHEFIPFGKVESKSDSSDNNQVEPTMDQP